MENYAIFWEMVNLCEFKINTNYTKGINYGEQQKQAKRGQKSFKSIQRQKT